MSYYDNNLKDVRNFNDISLSKGMGVNLKHFFEDNFIKLGAFTNIRIPQSSYNSIDYSRLRPVQLGTGTDGRTWETHFSNIVWESSHSGVIPITGLYINNTFSPSNNFNVDYEKGRITFASSIPTTSVVQLNYSFKTVSFRVGETALCTRLVGDSMDYEVGDLSATGIYNTLAENRLRMPCVFIRDISSEAGNGVELGNSQFYSNRIFFFYVFSDVEEDRDRLVDIFTRQTNKTIMMYNLDSVARSGVYPLNADGSLNPSGLSYSDLINNYSWKRCIFVRSDKDPVQYEKRLFRGIVRNTLEVQIG